MEQTKQYDPKKTETAIYDFWLKNNCFAASVNRDRKPFSIVIPPPNITGILHMGHALNNTIQDVIIRYKRMSGFETLWMPGTDHAGIATQNVVERQLAKEGKRKEDIGRQEFTSRLWKWKEKYGSTILTQLQKLGASCDWDRTRFTMDTDYSAAVNESFVRLYEKGLIYRGNYIINWCPRCQTALSDEEAPHSNIDGWLYYIRYPVHKTAKNASKIPGYIVVATTRPETMLGDTAIAIHPNDKRYKWLTHVTITLPILKRKLKLIKDKLIDPEFGTGAVKVTPAHDPVDFTLAKKHNLDFINIMNEDATLNDNAGDFSGMDRFEARQAILDLLEQEKLIEKREPYTVAAGHCYRCHTIIEPRLSPQWFVKMKPLAHEAIKVVEKNKIQFYPSRWKKVYLNWMNNIQDWCISRQIWWGHRLPVWRCAHCSKSTDDKFIVAREKPQKCPDCGSNDLFQENDVLDTWFSSWLWPFATFHWPKETPDLAYFYPTRYLITASEILFFWVARMIMAGLEFKKQIPFDTVLIHGTVRDSKGIKMSKSLGNTIDPIEIINTFGADALRFSLMLLASTGSDIYLSNEKFLVGRNFANKIWNATRFVMQRSQEIKQEETKGIEAVDVWILHEMNTAVKEVTGHLEKNRISDATKKIYDFFWHTFCDWYIEIAKTHLNEKRVKTLHTCLDRSLRLLHPIMPFITEEIYQNFRSFSPVFCETSITNAPWPKITPYKILEKERVLVESIISLIKEIRNLKMDLGLSVTQKIKARIKIDIQRRPAFEQHREWFLRLAGIQSYEYANKLSRVLYNNEYLELDFALDTFDSKRYITSLDKQIGKLSESIRQCREKLKNKKFLAQAPKDTIAREKQRSQTLSFQRERLERIRNAFSR